MLILVVAAGLVIAALIAWFDVLEVNDRRHTIFLVFVGVYLVEGLTMPEAASVPVGLFRPAVFGQDFRAPDLIIVAALAARLLAGRWERIGPVTLAWFPFVTLYAAGTVIGLALVGLPFAQVLFQGKLLLYLIGGAVIVAGADVHRLAEGVGRLGIVVAPIVPLAIFVNVTSSEFSFSTPVQAFPALGNLSNDTVTALVVLGAVVLACELVRKPPRLSAVIAGGVLLLAPLGENQRASYLSLVAAAGVLLLVLIGGVWRRRSVVSVAQVSLGLATAVAAGLVGFALGAPVSVVDQAFAGQANAESAEARISLYDSSIDLISEKPILGSGVGVQVETTRVNTGADLVTTAHNVLLDVWLRVGLIGAVFFFVAFVVTLWVGWRTWRTATEDSAAAVGVSAVIVLMGWFAKAMVEPGLDKFRLSVLLGVGVGLAAAAWRSEDERSRSGTPDPLLPAEVALASIRERARPDPVRDRS